MEKLFNTIFPPTCVICGNFSSSFCRACLDKATPLNEAYCLTCDKASINGETHLLCKDRTINKGSISFVFSAFIYKDCVRKCILKSKYGANEFAALKILSREAALYFSKCGLPSSFDFVCAVPLSKKKKKVRGFNQASLIAKVLCKELNLVYSDCLVRTSDTIPQHKLSKKERIINLSKSFKAFKNIQQKRILLVDDICTSGATLLSATEALFYAGASSVCCFTLAKKPLLKFKH